MCYRKSPMKGLQFPSLFYFCCVACVCTIVHLFQFGSIASRAWMTSSPSTHTIAMTHRSAQLQSLLCKESHAFKERLCAWLIAGLSAFKRACCCRWSPNAAITTCLGIHASLTPCQKLNTRDRTRIVARIAKHFRPTSTCMSTTHSSPL